MVLVFLVSQANDARRPNSVKRTLHRIGFTHINHSDTCRPLAVLAPHPATYGISDLSLELHPMKNVIPKKVELVQQAHPLGALPEPRARIFAACR